MKRIRVLFQGDSITDAGRNRLGIHSLAGYPKKTANLLKAKYGKQKYNFFNRGISGDRTKNLLKRYNHDFKRLNPDIITIMIGINDVWRAYDSNDVTTPETYKNNLIKLLTDVKKDMPDAKIIMLSPYLTPDPNGKHDEMRKDVDTFITACKEVSDKYADLYINTDIPMNEGAKTNPLKAISKDGVHPESIGQDILANLLSSAIEKLS